MRYSRNMFGTLVRWKAPRVSKKGRNGRIFGFGETQGLSGSTNTRGIVSVDGRPVDDCLDVEKLRRGDPDEFARFVGAHQRVVFALCQSQGLTPADAADIAAEVFSVAYRALGSFRGESRLSTWVYRIAHRTIVRHRRQRRAHERLPADLADETADGPAAPSEARETSAQVWAAVARLEPNQTAVVELFYRQGWSVETIAAVLEKPEGTVKTLLHRARQELKRLLITLENSHA
jgi:RNA polymerase sigma-70 factor, ECF subfamily